MDTSADDDFTQKFAYFVNTICIFDHDLLATGFLIPLSLFEIGVIGFMMVKARAKRKRMQEYNEAC